MSTTLWPAAKALLGAGAAISLAACATVPRPAPDEAVSPTTADRHAIAVDPGLANLPIEAAPGQTALSPQSRESIVNFARDYQRAGHGPMTISTPTGAANADAAAIIAQEARMRLVEAGVPYAAIAGAAYDARGEDIAPVVLGFATYEVSGPACAPLFTQDLAHQSNNQAWESFGCSRQANLAAMIDDPHDLVEPRAEDDRDATRRADVLGAYRRGESTAVVRTSDERVAISNSVN